MSASSWRSWAPRCMRQIGLNTANIEFVLRWSPGTFLASQTRLARLGTGPVNPPFGRRRTAYAHHRTDRYDRHTSDDHDNGPLNAAPSSSAIPETRAGK